MPTVVPPTTPHHPSIGSSPDFISVMPDAAAAVDRYALTERDVAQNKVRVMRDLDYAIMK